jgi:hypothetical protein
MRAVLSMVVLTKMLQSSIAVIQRRFMIASFSLLDNSDDRMLYSPGRPTTSHPRRFSKGYLLSA